MDEVLISRGFKWKRICERKSTESHFTVKDYKNSIDLAIKQLPEDLIVEEIVIMTERIQRKNGEIELQTDIYWKE